MKKSNIGLMLISIFSMAPVYAVTATPTQYTVTLSQVDFHKTTAASGSYTNYANGSTEVNIASVGAGQPCGQLNPTGNLTPGSYDEFRFTISKTMTVTGSSTGNLANGHPCRTVTGGALVTDPFGDGSITEAYQGSIDGAAAEPETVVVPGGTAVTLPTGFQVIGNNFQVTLPIAMTVAGSVPQGTISFDVTNAVQFEVLDATHCLVFPGPPTVNFDFA